MKATAKRTRVRKHAHKVQHLDKDRLRSLIDAVPAIIYVAALDGAGSTIFVNSQVACLGYAAEEWVADPELWSHRIHPDDRDRVLAEYARARDGGKPFRCEYRMLTRDGAVRWFRDDATLVRDDAGRPAYQQGFMVDITDRKLTQQALNESQHRFALFAQHVPGVAFVKDSKGRYMFINRVGEATIGAPHGVWLGRTDFDLLPADVAESLSANDARVHAEKRAVTVTEHLAGRTWLVTKFLIPDANEQHPLLGGIATDVTDRVDAEDRLRDYAERLQLLSRRVIEVQECERRHIARELHDDVSQELTGLGLMLEACLRDVPKAGQQLQQAMDVVNELIGRVRNLSLGLRPAVLDDLGLLPALTWHFERYTAQTGVHVSFSQRGLERRLPAAVETAAYRIIQEALTNVARHAGVRDVAVRIDVDAAQLRLTVEDRGRGFSAAAPAVPAGSGVIGMRERASALGGTLNVTSEPGTGTRLTTELPLHGGQAG